MQRERLIIYTSCWGHSGILTVPINSKPYGYQLQRGEAWYERQPYGNTYGNTWRINEEESILPRVPLFFPKKRSMIYKLLTREKTTCLCPSSTPDWEGARKSLCLVQDSLESSAERGGFWSTLHSIESMLRAPDILPNSLFDFSLHMCTIRFSCHWWKKKTTVSSSYLTSNRKHTAFGSAVSSGSQGKVKFVCVLLARSTESKISHLKTDVRH